jgi:hypothetical protein
MPHHIGSWNPYAQAYSQLLLKFGIGFAWPEYIAQNLGRLAEFPNNG